MVEYFVHTRPNSMLYANRSHQGLPDLRPFSPVEKYASSWHDLSGEQFSRIRREIHANG